jgi:hypothetical protein
MRLTNWVSPVYARLQRRFVRFLASNVEEKMEEMVDTSFDRLLKRVKIEISPPYALTGSSSSSVGEESRIYPAWELAAFVIKLLRNTVAGIELPSLEAKVTRMFQQELASKMRPLAKLEKLAATKQVWGGDGGDCRILSVISHYIVLTLCVLVCLCVCVFVCIICGMRVI